MNTKFDIAIASVQGSEHSRIGQNNQDAMFVAQGDKFLCGCVSDGCGSCARSEIGAVITTRLVTKYVPLCLMGSTVAEIPNSLTMAKSMIMASFRDISENMADFRPKPTLCMDAGAFEMTPNLATFGGVMATSMLATSFGFYACDEFVVVFHVGDGFYAINGNLVSVDTEAFIAKEGEPKKSNCPSYLIYNLMPNVARSMYPSSLNFAFDIFPMSQFDRLMIATDGVRFLTLSPDRQIPGKTSQVGGIEQLWEDSVFMKPFALQRRLGLLNHDVHIPDWVDKSMIVSGSILKDDATVISIRRRK